MEPTPLDLELEQLRKQIFSENLTNSQAQDSTKEKQINKSISLLQDLIKELDSLNYKMKSQAQLSKSNAIEAYHKLEIALRNQQMGEVFQKAIDQKAHIKFSSLIESSWAEIEVDIARLKTYIDLLKRAK